MITDGVHNSTGITTNIAAPKKKLQKETRSIIQQHKLQNRAFVESSSIPSTSVSTSSHHDSTWCTLAYWEGRQRVGRLFPVFGDYVNVFDSIAQGTGFCLSAFASDDDVSARTRKCIGNGVTIARDPLDGSVFIYNRSENPVFVHSPVFEPVTSRSVFKLPVGYCMRVFNFDLARVLQVLEHNKHIQHPTNSSSDEDQSGPTTPSGDMTSVRMSFVKGWGGGNYKRQSITACPCWMEIIFDIKQGHVS